MEHQQKHFRKIHSGQPGQRPTLNRPPYPKGKARSSQNAPKHGLLSHNPLRSAENPDELEKYRVAHRNKFQPADNTEQILVDLMVDAIWRIDRLHYLEVGTFEKATEVAKSKGLKDDMELLRVHTDSSIARNRSRLEGRHRTHLHPVNPRFSAASPGFK